MKTQVAHQDQCNLAYDSKKCFIRYWHQINEIMSRNSNSILEIGAGNGFVAGYLRKYGINVITMDIDNDSKPYVTGSVTSIPFAEGSFSAILCCEVLQHLPYETFGAALAEMHRVSNSYVVISIPDNGWFVSFSLKIPFFNRLDFFFSFPRLVRRAYKSDGHHYWVLGKAGYSLKVITDEIKKAGFTIQKTYRIMEVPGHRFFVLKKQEYGKG